MSCCIFYMLAHEHEVYYQLAADLSNSSALVSVRCLQPIIQSSPLPPCEGPRSRPIRSTSSLPPSPSPIQKIGSFISFHMCRLPMAAFFLISSVLFLGPRSCRAMVNSLEQVHSMLKNESTGGCSVRIWTFDAHHE